MRTSEKVNALKKKEKLAVTKSLRSRIKRLRILSFLFLALAVVLMFAQQGWSGLVFLLLATSMIMSVYVFYLTRQLRKIERNREPS